MYIYITYILHIYIYIYIYIYISTIHRFIYNIIHLHILYTRKKNMSFPSVINSTESVKRKDLAISMDCNLASQFLRLIPVFLLDLSIWIARCQHLNSFKANNKIMSKISETVQTYHDKNLHEQFNYDLFFGSVFRTRAISMIALFREDS